VNSELQGFDHERTVVVGGLPVTVRANVEAAWDARVVVVVPLHDQAEPLSVCLESIAQQEVPKGGLAVLVLDDGSGDDWTATVSRRGSNLKVIVGGVRCGSAAKARNAAIELVDRALPRARWVARLDADDRFSTSRSLVEACALGDERCADWILGGNRLVRHGELLDRVNPATAALLNRQAVLTVLDEMARGVAYNELPSCNLILRARSGRRYPEVASAEDHWLVAELLLNHAESGAIMECPYYCDYNLGGETTALNRRASTYLSSRAALHAEATIWSRPAGVGR
jgi:glycosyltransferase involved in cell wall biosynthesis